jgi:hypothetical protein
MTVNKPSYDIFVFGYLNMSIFISNTVVREYNTSRGKMIDSFFFVRDKSILRIGYIFQNVWENLGCSE